MPVNHVVCHKINIAWPSRLCYVFDEKKHVDNVPLLPKYSLTSDKTTLGVGNQPIGRESAVLLIIGAISPNGPNGKVLM